MSLGRQGDSRWSQRAGEHVSSQTKNQPIKTQVGSLDTQQSDVSGLREVLSRPEVKELLRAVASLQVTCYRHQLAQFEAYEARSVSLVGKIVNIFSYLANPQVHTEPKLLSTAFASGHQLIPRSIYPNQLDSDAQSTFTQTLNELITKNYLQAVVSPRGTGSLITVGVRIVRQDVFDAVK